MTEKDQEMLYKNLGLNIKKARTDKGYKQDSFAQMLNLSRASIVNIEKGRQRPTIHLLYEIASITFTPISDLLPRFDSNDSLNQIWRTKIQKSLQGDTTSEKNLSNFLIEVTSNGSEKQKKN
jgi:DNA-binding XRE family transcriptional regulator